MRKSMNKEFDGSKFWCRRCGNPVITASYTEITYGACTLVSVESDGWAPLQFDNYEDYDRQGFEVYMYSCDKCNEESESLKEMCTTDASEVVDKENFSWD
jgi:hypothetical protein